MDDDRAIVVGRLDTSGGISMIEAVMHDVVARSPKGKRGEVVGPWLSCRVCERALNEEETGFISGS
jgi:hypothetical protein